MTKTLMLFIKTKLVKRIWQRENQIVWNERNTQRHPLQSPLISLSFPCPSKMWFPVMDGSVRLWDWFWGLDVSACCCRVSWDFLGALVTLGVCLVPEVPGNHSFIYIWTSLRMDSILNFWSLRCPILFIIYLFWGQISTQNNRALWVIGGIK